jgi:hypothetical protein
MSNKENLKRCESEWKQVSCKMHCGDNIVRVYENKSGNKIKLTTSNYDFTVRVSEIDGRAVKKTFELTHDGRDFLKNLDILIQND